ncbi:penicillin acylase family protein [Dongia sp.]|uniref:penicillin acylase family protein n=1 Tax=Dongia sp. TaxID=1977262 RepID=UPI0035AF27A5
MVKGLRWLLRVFVGILAFVIVLGIGGFLWLRTSLPLTDGTIALNGPAAEISVTRDERGIATINAQSSADAYFALGFVHAQERLFQMDAMRRLGAGRLSEVLGADTLETDRLMRTLGLYRSAEDQVRAASPALKAALDAYAAGVNAFIAAHEGAWPPEFYLLNYRPEPWQPADSLVWGRLMALDLSNNWQAEVSNRSLRRGVPDYLFNLLVASPSPARAQNGDGAPAWRQPLSEASNSWVVGPHKSASGKPLIANDPHLGLALPATWYLARIETPEMTWTGATAPGLPFVMIGSNGHVAWTFTTTHGDTQDLFEEKLVTGHPDRYETPDGPKPFDIRRETIAIKGAPEVELTIRSTRHGPVVSDLGGDPGTPDTVLALSWTALLPGDRTPESILAMNRARDAAALEVALVDFHAPEQNVVYADAEGVTGFVAAGRVPERRAIFAESRLPAPGWSGTYDWIGTLPMSSLPQLRGDSGDFLVTANNDIRPLGYRPFITADWPEDGRAKRIRSLLGAKDFLDLAAMQAIQTDNHSAPLLAFVRHWLDLAEQAQADPDLAMLAAWDGTMARDQAAPLIATIWVDRLAKRLLKDEMRGHFADWWFWQLDRLDAALDDGRACDDIDSPAKESCDEIVRAALDDTRKDLAAAYGADTTKWRWGDSHRAPFNHPVYRHLPLIGDWLAADLPTDGDFFSVNRGTSMPPRQDVSLTHVHGPGLRFLMDFAAPDKALFALAGGQSGNPLSPHFADGLANWRDGLYRTIGDGGVEQLILQPTEAP